MKKTVLFVTTLLLSQVILSQQNDPTQDSWVDNGTKVYTNSNTGIGTNEPKEALQIGSSTPFTIHNGGWKGLSWNTYYDNGWKKFSGSNKTAFRMLYAISNNEIRFNLSKPSMDDQNIDFGTTELTLEENKVGIGTTSPKSMLHVQTNVNDDRGMIISVPDNAWNIRGGAYKDLSILEDGNDGNEIFFKSNLIRWGWNSITKEGDSGIFFADHKDGSCCNQESGLIIAPASGSKKGIRINAEGALSVNTNHVPNGYAFSVDGKGIMEELTVRLSQNWPDFVFEKDYNLQPLEEVQTYIENNGHLPGIPQATEIYENGVDLGELVRLQMMKIEELTLHLIAQKETIEKLKKKVSNLHKDN